MVPDLGEHVRNLNNSETIFINKLTSSAAEWAYEKTHKDVENTDGKEEYIEFFKYSFRTSLFFLYFPLPLLVFDLILSQVFSLIYSTSTSMFLNLPLYRMFGFTFLLLVALARSHSTLIPSGSPWALTENQSLGLNHGGMLLLYGGVIYTLFSFINEIPGLMDFTLLFIILTSSIGYFYSEVVDYQINTEEIVRFQKEELQLKAILWDSTKRTLSVTGIFLIVSAGLFDLIATRVFQTGTLTGTKIIAGPFLFFVTFYIYGLSFRVFTYNESISLSFGFLVCGFRNTVMAVFQAALIFAASFVLTLTSMYALNFVGFSEGGYRFIHFLTFIPFLLELVLITSLVFTPYYGIISGEFVSSFKKSWRLAAGHRIAIFFYGSIGLMIGCVIVLVLLIPTSILIQAYPGELSQSVSSILIPSIFIYLIALFSDVFNSLR